MLVVICGTRAGKRSATEGVYYASRGNLFWSVLERVGLTPRKLAPIEFRTLLHHGIGLTDLSKVASGSDSQLGRAELDVPTLLRKIESFRPMVLAFNGKRAAEAFLGRPVEYGLQPEKVGQTILYVLPSTSGNARRYWDGSHWQGLARLVRRLREDSTA